PARGELHRPIAGIPAITVLLEHEREYARANTPLARLVRVFVQNALGKPQLVRVRLGLPRGLHTDSAVRAITLPAFGSTSSFFRVQGTLTPGQYFIDASAEIVPPVRTDSVPARASTSRAQVAGLDPAYRRGFVPVEYRHIQPQRFYRQAVIALEAVDIKFPD